MIKEKVLKAKEIVTKLGKIANDNKKMTNEEKELILNIGKNVNRYFQFIKDIPPGQEFEKTEDLSILEKKIVQDATAKAFEDGQISQDERRLLQELVKLMEEIAKIN